MYFLYFSYGSCTHQDHDCDLEKFDTKAEALVRIAELRKHDCDAFVRLVEGVEVTLPAAEK